jgi:hypothetical protein
MFYPMAEYKLVRFEKSNARNKKYDAILENKISHKLVKVSFGDIRYNQYKDSTPNKLYSNKDHGDLNRRRLYRLRHAKDIKPGYFSPGYMSMKYLW